MFPRFDIDDSLSQQLGPLLQEMMEPMHSNFGQVRNALSLRREWAHSFTTFRVALYPFGDHDVGPWAQVPCLALATDEMNSFAWSF
jgi:hypothetical protein